MPSNAVSRRRCRALRRAPAPLFDWLFPPACVLCAAPGDVLCAACRRDATTPGGFACDRCAIPMTRPSNPGAVRVCGRCLRKTPAFDRTLAAVLYTAPFDQLIRRFKYGATLAYAPLFADLIVERVATVRGDTQVPIDCLVPVPLSRDRMASRGFNQSTEIARLVARSLESPLDTTSVLRIEDTAPQASLPSDERRRNVRGAFAVVDDRRARLAGRHIGIVDDVMTTGATLDELARIVKRAGAASVTALVVARTP